MVVSALWLMGDARLARAEGSSLPDDGGVGWPSLTPGAATRPLWSNGSEGAPERDQAGRSAPETPRPKKQPNFQIGPVLGFGVPNLVNFGLTAKVTPYLGFGAGMGVVPKLSIPVYGQATIAYTEYDVYARVYPFGGGFFVGSGVGYEKFKGTLSRTMNLSYSTSQGSYTQDVSFATEAAVGVLIVTPHLGYLHTFDSGFLLGFEAGALIPVQASEVEVTNTLPAEVPATTAASLKREQEDALRQAGSQVLPSVMFRTGWLF